MRIEFEVPKGIYCKDCPHQENFEVEEIECTTIEDKYPRYIRIITATCHLFKESIQGISLENMEKCFTCKQKTSDL